jgi:UDP-N-acetylmuramoyl-L-alanyl-D-glutamate--2,6-diaminopimelate ligase
VTETLLSLSRRVGGFVVGNDSVEIADVVHDHREGAANAMFVARRGLTADGHDFVEKAATVCAAVCVEHAFDKLAVPQLVVADSTGAMGLLASAVHGDPFGDLRAVGVTGTNGKTMVTHLIGSIVAASGGIPAVAGTLGWRVGEDVFPLARTSPEATDLHRMAGAMVRAGVDIAAFEVSSHALALQRVIGASFAVAAFTNLSRDHLDFHRGMDDYFNAKASLFRPELSDHAVVWVDDSYGSRLAAACGIPVTTVGTAADVSVSEIEVSSSGSTFTLAAPEGSGRIVLPLPGSFNIANAAVAAASTLQLDVPFAAVVAGLERARPVRGRFEPVAVDAPFQVIVDYAHTPDGIEQAVVAARGLTPRRILVVTGAGGDRDKAKRPEMGRAAALADVVIITTDNPRSEDAAAIAAEIISGVGEHAAVTVELDRRAAIRLGLTEAGAGDMLLILGKGHEQGQEFADHVAPFDDASVVRQEAAAL